MKITIFLAALAIIFFLFLKERNESFFLEKKVESLLKLHLNQDSEIFQKNISTMGKPLPRDLYKTIKKPKELKNLDDMEIYTLSVNVVIFFSTKNGRINQIYISQLDL